MPGTQGTIYSIDANAMIYAWIEAYRPESFASFWQRLDELIEAGRARISEEVLEEVRRKEDGLYAWLHARSKAIVPHTDDVQANVTRILATHPLLVKQRKNRSGADPFVIAVAMCERATVVSQEGSGSDSTPKIPDVCKAYGIPLIRLGGLISAEGWRF